MRFPKGCVVTTTPTPKLPNGALAGHKYEVRLNGQFMASGWSAGSKRDAREEAWKALEQMGLVTDGIDS